MGKGREKGIWRVGEIFVMFVVDVLRSSSFEGGVYVLWVFCIVEYLIKE